MKNKLFYVIGFFILLDLIFLYRPLIKGEVFVPGDYLKTMSPWNEVQDNKKQWNVLEFDGVAQFYVWRNFYTDSIKKGEMPYFNPYELSGTNFVGTGQSAVFYPINLLLVLFGVDYGMGVLAFVHLFMMQIFMFLFLRRFNLQLVSALIGAVGYSFCGFMICWIQLPTLVMTAAWLPGVLYFIKRAFEEKNIIYGLLGGMCLGMSVLAGHLQIAIFVILVSFIYLVYNFFIRFNKENGNIRTILSMMFLVAFLFVASFQMLPSLELWRESARFTAASAEGYKNYISNGLDSFRLITAFIPNIMGSTAKNNFVGGSGADYIEYSIYMGVLPLFLAIYGLLRGFIARNKSMYFFVGLFVFAYLIICGSFMNYPLYYYIPGFSSMGGPNRLIFVGIFNLVVLSAFGFNYFVYDFDKNRDAKIIWYSYAALSLLIIISVGLLAAGVNNAAALFFLHAGTFIVLFICLFFFLLLRLCDLKTVLPIQLFAVVFLVLDLFIFGMGFPKTTHRDFLRREPGVIAYIKTLDYARVAFINDSWSLIETPKAVMPPNTAMLYGIYEVGGYDSLYLSDYRNKLTDILGTDPSPLENGNMLFVKKYTPGLGELCDIVVSKNIINDDTLKLLKVADRLYIYRIKNASVVRPIFIKNYLVKIPEGKSISDVFINSDKWVKRGENTYMFSPKIVTLPMACASLFIVIVLYFLGKHLIYKEENKQTF